MIPDHLRGCGEWIPTSHGCALRGTFKSQGILCLMMMMMKMKQVAMMIMMMMIMMMMTMMMMTMMIRQVLELMSLAWKVPLRSVAPGAQPVQGQS